MRELDMSELICVEKYGAFMVGQEVHNFTALQ